MRLSKISIIIIGIGLAIFGIFYTQEIEQNEQLSTEKDLPEDQELTVQKTWIEIDPIQCLGNPLEQDWLKTHNDDYTSYPRNVHTWQMDDGEIEVIKEYYQKNGITVHDVRYGPWGEVGICEGCGCPQGYTLYLLVSDSEIGSLSGFKISTEEALNHVNEKPAWKFIPVEPYSCGDSDCVVIYPDSKCGRGYLIKNDGEFVTPKERGILFDNAVIDYTLCE